MHVHPRQEILDRWNLRQDLITLLRMLLHDLVFFISQCGWLLQDAVVDSDLAYVVKQAH